MEKINSFKSLSTTVLRKETWNEHIVVDEVSIEYTCVASVEEIEKYPLLLLRCLIQLENIQFFEMGEQTYSEPFEIILPLHVDKDDPEVGRAWVGFEEIPLEEFKGLCFETMYSLLALIELIKRGEKKSMGNA